MMANLQFKFLLTCLCILVAHTTKGVDGQCATPPVNEAYYEETQNTMLTCNSPTKVSYTVKPSTEGLTTYTITNYDDTVPASLNNLYAVNQNSLIIKVAQGNAAVPPISTAGLYIINPNGTNRVGAKIVVVREPPTCNCKSVNTTRFTLTCSMTYSDVNYMPINAIMKWTINGNSYQTDTPARTASTSYYVSTSTITVTASNPVTYACTVTFSKPGPQFAYVAQNAPTFNASCSISTCPITATTIPTTLTSTKEPTTTVIAIAPSTEGTTTEGTTTEGTTTEGTTAEGTSPASVTSTPPPNTECVCTPSTACPTPDPICTKTSECRADGSNRTDVYSECVVKAESYARCDNCCPDNLICGVVVTLRNDSRWLIYDPQCDDNKCEMSVVSASCMSSEWKQLSERKVTVSGVGDYVQAGYSVQFGLNVTDCSDSCKRMMNLP